MRRLSPTWGLWLLPLFALQSSVAWAQARVSVQDSDGDNGIRLGDGRLHPYASVDTHFIFNPGRLSASRRQSAFPGRPNQDGFVTTTGGLEYLLPSRIMELNFRGQASTNQYFEYNDELSGFNAVVESALVGFKDGPLEFRVTAGYIRNQQPANQTVASTVDHNDATGSAGITVRPGGGALAINLNYSVYYQNYDNDEENRIVLGDPELYNNLRQSPSLRIDWNFLPKTAIFAEALMEFTRYLDDDVGVNFRANTLATSLGITGAVSNRLGVVAKAGFGRPFTENDGEQAPVVGQLEFDYRVSETAFGRVGYERVIEPQPFFGYTFDNRGYIGWEQSVAAVQLEVVGDIGRYSFGPSANLVLDVSEDSRNDFYIGAGIAVTYAITDWLNLGIANNIEFRDSNNENLVFTRGDAVDEIVDGVDFGYIYNDLFLTLSGRY